MNRFRTEPLLPNDLPAPEGASSPARPEATPSPEQQLTRPRQVFTAVLPGTDAPLSHRPTVNAAGPETTPYDAATRPPVHRLLTGQILAGKYELGKRLGVGGMGEVYRAAHLSLGVDVAVKIMHPHVAQIDEFMRRFRREAYAASLLNHRNVVRVLDFGEDDARLFIVMELLRGQSMNAWLSAAAAPPPLAECTEIFGQVLDAFEAAHAAGIVHRDLKPENVFLTVEADGRRVAKVLDFGLAHVDDYRDAGPTLTRADIVSGTPEYMSPEQCRSLAVGSSTDLYAIGCLLTDMLQLAPPFSGNPVEVMTQQMFVPPPPLRRPASAEPVPPLLERLRVSLLAKLPDMRPPDVREVKRLLAEAMSPEATALRLPGRKDADARGEMRAAPAPAPAPGSPAPLHVALIGLNTEHSQWANLAMGLAAQGITSVEPAPGEAPEAHVHAVVLDAGDDVDAAADWLVKRGSRVPVLVCLTDVTADRMSSLIASGAKDILPHPVTSDTLARKLRRATRARG